MISLNDGLALKSFRASNPGRMIAFQPASSEQSATPDQLAGFSSAGPTIGDAALKPDLLAVGTNVFMASQSYDPLGGMYSADGFAVADGTSFSTPLISGAAALVKQQHPQFSSAQVKSALLNTTAQTIFTDRAGNTVDILQVGAGKLDAAAAVSATVTSVPASISFGALRSGSLPKTVPLQITNTGAGAVTLEASILVTTAGATIALDKSSLTLQAGASDTLNVTLSGTVPSPGTYYGAVRLQAPGVSLRIPYLFLVGDGNVANLIPLSGSGFDGTVGQQISGGSISLRLLDSFGLPVPGVQVTFTAQNGGSLKNVHPTTDAYGIAYADAFLGAQAGGYSFSASARGQSLTFSGFARPQPTIFAGGAVNAASFDSPVAPGSYISIFGSGLSDFTDYPIPAVALPLAIDYANVSFDVPSAGLSVPGHLTFVSAGQVNLQVPWELQGQTAAQVKVTIFYSAGNVVTVPLADCAPAFFETGPNTVAALDIAYNVINAGNPVTAGQAVQLFANGLGPVTNQPASGDSASASPLSWTTTVPEVMIGGHKAEILFSGLAPGFAGLYQVNVLIPAGLDPGPQSITVAIGGKTSKPSGIIMK